MVEFGHLFLFSPMATSTLQKPAPLKWAKGLSIFQLITAVVACAFFIWLFQSASNSEFIMGMQEGAADGIGKDTLYLSSAEGMGYIVGIFLFALVGPVLTMLAIAKRSKGLTIASLIINGAGLLTSFSPVTLAVIILLVQKSSREYLHLSK